MNYLQPAALLLFSAPFASALAQFPVVNVSPNWITPIASLNSGPAYVEPFDYTATSFVVRNLDLSVRRVLNYPAAPQGMAWNSSRVMYITEALFDTDPSTIEFVLQATETNSPYTSGVFVFREDGTQLFSQVPGMLGGAVGVGFTSSAPIYAVNDETYMVVQEGLLAPTTTVYALPGSLPCLSCYGWPDALGSNVGIDGADAQGSGSRLQPNPADEQVSITLDPTMIGIADRVTVWDASGRQVMTQNVGGAARVTLDIRGLAAGTYSVVLSSDGRQLKGEQLVISR